MDESKEAHKIKKDLTKKLLKIEQNMNWLKCEALLEGKGTFTTTRAKY